MGIPSGITVKYITALTDEAAKDISDLADASKARSTGKPCSDLATGKAASNLAAASIEVGKHVATAHTVIGILGTTNPRNRVASPDLG